MQDVPSVVLDTIRGYGMFEPGESVLVAVSGGPDSVCLLRVLRELSGELRLQLTVAHLDHSTRNGESREDANFVRSLAERSGLECCIETVDVARLKPPGDSFEAAARRCRYEFFARVAGRTGSTKVALGHTANDQAETMLMRLISGAGRRGLAAIKPVRALGDVMLVRPLIHVRRNEILRYLESNNVEFRMDRTNLDTGYLRNKIRLELIPTLEREYNPRVVDALLQAASLLQEEEDYLSGRARDLAAEAIVCENASTIAVSRAAYSSASPVLRRRLVLDIVNRLSEKAPRITSASIEAADALCVSGRTGSEMRICDDVALLVEYGRILARKVSADASRGAGGYSFAVPLPGRISIDALGVELETAVFPRSQSVDDLVARCGTDKQYFDADRVRGDLSVRTRLPGDYFYPLGLGGRKKLSDYFIDAKYPRGNREEAILLLSGEDIMWVVGGSVDERFKLTNATRKVLEVRCARVDQAAR